MIDILNLDFERIFRKYNLEFSDKLLSQLVEVFTDKNPFFAFSVVCDNFKSRFYEFEPILLKDDYIAIRYAESYVNERWIGLERLIIKNIKIQYVARYAQIIDQRWPMGEQALLNSTKSLFKSKLCFEYAKIVIRDRWPEAESIILEFPSVAFKYAKQVLKGRWPEAEHLLLKDRRYRTKYRKFIKKTCGINLS